MMEDGAFIHEPSELHVTELSTDGVAVLLVAGDLDIATAPALCRRLVGRNGQRVVIDLSRAGFCDLAGIRAVAEARNGGAFALVAPEGCSARRVLDVSRLSERVEVHEERARAIARIRPSR
jgi:anti-anti-sigma factor